jgi:phage-related protein
VTKAPDKPLVWLRTEITTRPLSQDARIEAEVLLRRLEWGEFLSLPHSLPMPSIGSHCHELGIVDRDDAWRIIYRIDSDAIMIVEVFSKTSQKAPAAVTNQCRVRIRAYDEVTGKRS